MTKDGLYFNELVSITKDYLGPAAERFVKRQIESHLKKNPDQLQKSDIASLAIRIRSGLFVLTRDENVVEEAYSRLSSIAD